MRGSLILRVAKCVWPALLCMDGFDTISNYATWGISPQEFNNLYSKGTRRS